MTSENDVAKLARLNKQVDVLQAEADKIKAEIDRMKEHKKRLEAAISLAKQDGSLAAEVTRKLSQEDGVRIPSGNVVALHEALKRL